MNQNMVNKNDISDWFAANRDRQSYLKDVSRVDKLIENSQGKIADQSTRIDSQLSRLTDYSKIDSSLKALRESRNLIYKDEDEALAKSHLVLDDLEDYKKGSKEKEHLLEDAKIATLSLEAKKIKFEKDLQEVEQKTALVDRGLKPRELNLNESKKWGLDSLDIEASRGVL